MSQIKVTDLVDRYGTEEFSGTPASLSVHTSNRWVVIHQGVYLGHGQFHSPFGDTVPALVFEQQVGNKIIHRIFPVDDEQWLTLKDNASNVVQELKADAKRLLTLVNRRWSLTTSASELLAKSLGEDRSDVEDELEQLNFEIHELTTLIDDIKERIEQA